MSWWDGSLHIRWSSGTTRWRCTARGGGKRTYAAVAADVGVTGERLRSWVRQADEVAGRGQVRGVEAAEDRDEELARLRAELGRLRKAEKEWELEREVLRRAAQYFASMAV